MTTHKLRMAYQPASTCLFSGEKHDRLWHRPGAYGYDECSFYKPQQVCDTCRTVYGYDVPYPCDVVPPLTDEQVEAAAKAMYECRPHALDPVHWETPWEDVPEAWKRGQRRAARKVLEAGLSSVRPEEQL